MSTPDPSVSHTQLPIKISVCVHVCVFVCVYVCVCSCDICFPKLHQGDQTLFTGDDSQLAQINPEIMLAMCEPQIGEHLGSSLIFCNSLFSVSIRSMFRH